VGKAPSAGPDTPAVPPRADLPRLTVAVLNRGRIGNPDVLLVERDGRRVVVKDFAPRPPWVRATWGRWITAREARAWRALSGHPAVPRFLGAIDALAFAVEYRPGRRMSRQLKGAVPEDFVDRLAEAVDEMHRRGVAHLDLRHRSNVLADDAGRPVLIDFGSAVTFRPGSLACRWLLPLLARLDRAALGKWRERISPSPPRPQG
jgi:predicted Ser/Thr protein kinase